MGCDGGTIPKRDELVRTKQKSEQKDKRSDRVYRWRHCSVSQTLLRMPVVACELGRLYNKEEILTRLLNKTQEASNISHIRGLKDVRELTLTANPAYRGEEEQRGADTNEIERAQWSCPVSGLEMNGKHGFSFSWTCGCVIAYRAMKEIKDACCIKCEKAIAASDVITLNPSGEQLVHLEESMVDRRRKAKEAKKLKESVKRAATATSSGEQAEASEGAPAKKQKISKVASQASTSKSVTSVSGLASSILRGTDFSNVRSKEFSVAKNPNHSEVYKSIFDTHKSANKKLKSNWVTCNPQYY